MYAIIGAAIEVHRELNSGYYEAVYQEAMEMELESRSIPFQRQVALPLRYKGRPLKKEYVAALVCYGTVLVELKAMEHTTGREQSQVLHYLEATGIRVGLLINFGNPTRLDWQRLVR